MTSRKKKNGSSDNGQFWYDEDAADKVLEFFHSYIHHSKGEWAGQKFVLQPWQEKNIRDLFGWKRKDGTRKYRTTYWELPRKNGKSFLASAVGLYLLFADGEPGAEIYSAAADREQAAIVFGMAQDMVAASPALAKRAEVFRRSIVVPATNSSYKVLSADASTKYGFSVHGLLFDELMAQPNRSLWDALTTASGARRQPLIFAISTAGFDRQSLCWEIHQYAEKVRDGIIEDPSFLPVLFGAADDDDWTSPTTWEKANPNYGVTIKREYIEQECRRAQETPAYENTFRRLLLDQWTEQSVRWMPMEKWDEGNFAEVTLAKLAGREVYIGVDLSTTTDLTSVTVVAPPLGDEDRYHALFLFFVPEENIVLRARRDRVDYGEWVRRGHITATPGAKVDHKFIFQQLLNVAMRCQIKEVIFDPWNSTALITMLQEEGVQCVEFRQGYRSMNAPVKELLALVLAQKLNHGGNPVARWCFSNAVVTTDPAGNQKLDRAKSTEKIDACISLAMALARAMLHREEGGSVYETRGIVSLGDTDSL